MINTSYRYLGLSRLWLGLFYALFVLGHSAAMADWKEANAALEAGKMSEALSQIRSPTGPSLHDVGDTRRTACSP